MKRLAVFLLATALSVWSAAVAAAQCPLPGFTQLPSNPPIPIALGPLMYFYAFNYPDVANAVIAARDAWNVTEAVGRLGGYGGQTNSDCPVNQPLQIGAYNFFTNPPCPTAEAYNVHILPPPSAPLPLAFVDYFPSKCAGCGTKSMSLNTYVPWAINPGPGQFDLQSVITHEFGHMLGLAHMRAFQCTDDPGPNCAVDPLRDTMTSNADYAETCWRDLNFIDVGNANSLY